LQRGIASEGRLTLTPTRSVSGPETELFSRCRHAFDFPPARYYATMGLQDGVDEPNLALISAASAAGRSQSFFFLSPDQQLIAKSCTEEDWSTLLRILPEYVEYVEAAAARQKVKPARRRTSFVTPGAMFGFYETLLPRYLGLYSVLVGEDNVPVKVLVMVNAFSGGSVISRRYDLKGSTHGRLASKKEIAKKTPIYKDIDFVSKEPVLRVNSEHLTIFRQAMRADCEFLARHGLMDYSLLVGVHDRDKGEAVLGEVMNVVAVRDVTRLAYLGIIDVLTPYKMRKRAETFVLGTMFCGRDVSCQHPNLYAKRFCKFMEEHVIRELDDP